MGQAVSCSGLEQIHELFSSPLWGGGNLWEKSANPCKDSWEKSSQHFNPFSLLCHYLLQAVDL